MMRLRTIALALSWSLAVVACGKRDEPTPAASTTSAPSASASIASASSASTPTSAATAAASDVPPSPSASSSAATLTAAQSLVGKWKFSGFDTTDPSTKATIAKLPPAAQAQVSAEASKVTVQFTDREIVLRMVGEPENRSAYSVVPGDTGATDVVIKTTEGRKRIRFLDAARKTIRVEELDKPGAPVALMARVA
jgi:hypothetical protein